MTREHAAQVAYALDQVESFEVAMDIMEQALDKAVDVGCDLQGFDEKVRALMEEELKRRMGVLESL